MAALLQRGEGAGVAVALLGHGVVLALLSLTLVAKVPPPLPVTPVDVSLVDEVGLRATAPATVEEP
ncbi:MAG: cell envelope biogenesis protein TolA, partial [Sphingomonas sp.]|nr:cell envelope biogenesis protein TolA [Sphingomonas sp.]